MLTFTKHLQPLLLILFILVTISKYAFAVAPKKNVKEVKDENSFSLQELEKYYSTISHGAIVPSGKAKNKSKLKVRNEKPKTFKFELENYQDYDDVQDYFSTDVLRFTELLKEKDFLSAKKSLAKRHGFDTASEQHFKPCVQLHPWGPLPHPPIKNLILPLEAYSQRMSKKIEPTEKSPYFNLEFQKNLDKVSNTHLTSGNELKLLLNDNAYKEKLRFINEAKESLNITVMAFFCDDSSNVLADAIIKKAKEGVKIKLIVDGLYRRFIAKKCLKKIEKSGVEIVKIDEFYHGAVMHNKFWIKDGKEAILGGMNILEAENEGTGFNGNNRDTDIFIKGPIVTDLSEKFVELWEKNRAFWKSNMKKEKEAIEKQKKNEEKEGLRGVKNYSKWLEDPSTRKKGLCRLAVQGSKAKDVSIVTILNEYAKAAQKNILFSSPTVEFDLKKIKKSGHNQLVKTIIDKSNKDGVEVDIVSNGYGGGTGELSIMIEKAKNTLKTKENRFLQWIREKLENFGEKKRLSSAKTNRESFERLFQQAKDIQGHMYFQYVHAKQYLFDDTVASVGSWNLDENSSKKNHETQLFCQDEQFARKLKEEFVLDMVNSSPLEH
ncbi:MAG: phosphatidylserine/phosphatidylglycerophosphate/cardiolipin synthase family protein [Oligoflexia bacterium]|nr:phosphatidylserine/phosphatidylglycerophosphate/cardiolipin synthase family protein [Oligoflexia bacterium]